MSAEPAQVSGSESPPAVLGPPDSGVAPWHPPPTYPPPRAHQTGGTDRRAVAAFLAAVFGILLGLPFGLPGMILGPLAYFLGRSAAGRIDASHGATGGRGLAVAGWVLGAVAMAIGSAVTLVWLVILLVLSSEPATYA